MRYFQQGDVLVKEYKGETLGEIFKDSLLHKGENHHHRLSGGAFVIIQGGGNKYLEVAEDTTLTHEEHKTIGIPAGKYIIGIVQEYSHWEEESKNVID